MKAADLFRQCRFPKMSALAGLQDGVGVKVAHEIVYDWPSNGLI